MILAMSGLPVRSAVVTSFIEIPDAAAARRYVRIIVCARPALLNSFRR
jgi:hypothetical protein